MDSENALKQQLAGALKARKQLEDTYEGQFKILTQLVARLTLVCKGIDIELDNKLARLRTELQKSVDLEKILPLIDGTNEHLKILEARQQQDVKKTQLALVEAGKLLQKQRGLPNQLRRDLRDLLTQVDEPAASVQTFLPHLIQLTGLYQYALSARSNEDDDGVRPLTMDLNDQEAYRTIATELIQLLSKLAFEGPHAKAIETIRFSLLSDLSVEKLLDCCLKTVEIIIASIHDERQSAQKFLFNLNEALSTVQQALTTSLSASNNIQQKMHLLNQQIEQQIELLGQQTQSATTLEQLQLLVSDKLGQISLSLKSKEQLERQEREMLFKAVKDMEQRLKGLEQEASQFKKRLAEQKFRSLQDALTELPNRAAFDERYELEIKRMKRSGKPLSIVLADVDHFKNINDSYGHSAGDKTLKVIAKALKQHLRDTDFIARYGGEEFILLFPETPLEDLTGPLNLIREKIKRIPFKFKDTNVPITISFGATQLKTTDSHREAFDRADEALYDAKRNGRDKVMFKQ